MSHTAKVFSAWRVRLEYFTLPETPVLPTPHGAEWQSDLSAVAEQSGAHIPSACHKDMYVTCHFIVKGKHGSLLQSSSTQNTR
ncbi:MULTISPECIES: hypothetical protein [Vibrio oreintalis group]|uniref:Uncharacterized protein n=1 Tax=Vibrio bivalvicida TaxID=1276888 RepID=A0ABV4MNM2_9VIBR